MNTRRILDRVARHARGIIATALALLVIPSLLTASLHHHGDGESRHGCVICVAAHAPAEIAPHVAPGAPAAPQAEQVTEVRASRPCAAPRTATAPRGPPAA